MSSLRRSLAAVALASLLAVSLATAKDMTKTIEIIASVKVAGVTLKPGVYTLKVSDTTGPETDVIIQNGKQEVRAKASWISLDRKAPNTAIVMDEHKALKQLRFAGKDRALSFTSTSASAVN